MNPPAPRCTPFQALPWLAKANAVGLCAAAGAVAVLLWPYWRRDADLSHGVLLPLVFAILIAESRRDPGPRYLGAGPAAILTFGCLLAGSLFSLAAAIAYAAALGWSYAMAEFMLAVALVLALAAGWLAFADERVRFLPLNWPAAVGASVWLFASLPPPGTYARLSLALQGWVTSGVVWVLEAAGIAASAQGNVIELARTSVGVTEACSGVRSLITCTVAGLFLSALLVRCPRNRALLVVLSPALGVAMNFLRSLFLTLLANAGVDIEGRWHDWTGASIAVVTTLLVAGVAVGLHRSERKAEAGAPGAGPAPVGRSPLQPMLAAGLVVAVGAVVLLLRNGGAAGATRDPAPSLDALFPAPLPGWTAEATPDLAQYSGVLRTQALAERTYSEGAAAGEAKLVLYVAYWRAGEAPVSLVDAHTPDICWPGSGWQPKPAANGRVALRLGDRTLPPAECRVFAFGSHETHVWFWHLYGGSPLGIIDPHSALRLLQHAWRYGFARDRDQMFVQVSSNRPWEELASLPTIRQFVANLEPLGLR